MAIDIAPTKHSVFEEIYMGFVNNLKYKTLVLEEPCDIQDITLVINMLQEYENDSHTVVMGQNGSGKSYLMLLLLKDLLVTKIFDNMMFAKHTTNDIVDFILHKSNTVLGIDELNQFFDYKQHATEEQQHLIRMIELGREKRIGFIGCARDIKKLTLNYRNGKVSVVLWIVDRYMDGGSYAAVFVANPLIEGSDRFGFNALSIGVVDFQEMRSQLEQLPTFCGYLKIPNVYEILTKEEVTTYKSEKQIAMAYAHLKNLVKNYSKKKIDKDEFTEEVKRLSDKIPKDIIDKYLNMAEKSRYSSKKTKSPKETLKDTIEEESEGE